MFEKKIKEGSYLDVESIDYAVINTNGVEVLFSSGKNVNIPRTDPNYDKIIKKIVNEWGF